MLLIDMPLPSTVLAVTNRTSSDIPFMQTVNPITRHQPRFQNRYRHPHAEAVARLRTSGAEMHLRPKIGGLMLQTDEASGKCGSNYRKPGYRSHSHFHGHNGVTKSSIWADGG